MGKVPFDVDLALDAGVFVSAVRQHGKTKLCELLVDRLIDKGCFVKVFDVSKAWNDSNIPYRVTLKDCRNVYYPQYGSVVFDLSRLYMSQQQMVVQLILGADFRQRTASDKPKGLPWTVYVFEEAQIIMPNGSLRSSYAQEALRTVSVGANFNLGYMLVSQRPADVSTKAISRCSQFYLGRHIEVNDVTKLKRFLGIRKYDEAHLLLSKLHKRQFIYYNGNKLKKFTTPNYIQHVTQREYRKPSFWQRLFNPNTEKFTYQAIP